MVILFGGRAYYPGGGVGDILAIYDALPSDDVLREHRERLMRTSYGDGWWLQLFDVTRMRVKSCCDCCEDSTEWSDWADWRETE